MRFLLLTCLLLAAPSFAVEYRFYHPDPLGSNTLVTDRSGNVVQRTVTDPYGETKAMVDGAGSSVAPGANSTRHLFTGQEHDPESDLQYFGARYYDPFVGGFLSQDPVWIGSPLTALGVLESKPAVANGYSYALNQPTLWTDPSGQIPEISDGSTDTPFFRDPLREVPENSIALGMKRAKPDGTFHFLTAEDAIEQGLFSGSSPFDSPTVRRTGLSAITNTARTVREHSFDVVDDGRIVHGLERSRYANRAVITGAAPTNQIAHVHAHPLSLREPQFSNRFEQELNSLGIDIPAIAQFPERMDPMFVITNFSVYKLTLAAKVPYRDPIPHVIRLGSAFEVLYGRPPGSADRQLFP